MNYNMKILPSNISYQGFAFSCHLYIEGEWRRMICKCPTCPTRKEGVHPIKKMDAAAEQHEIMNWDEMTKSDPQVLDIIRRYSVDREIHSYGKTCNPQTRQFRTELHRGAPVIADKKWV